MGNKNANRVIKTFNKKLASKVSKNLNDSKSSGSLKKSVKLLNSSSTKGYTISISMEDYGMFVDEGRKPRKGMPVDKLKDWIKTKKMTVKDANGNSVAMTDSKMDGLAFVINRKIKNEGIKPTYFLTKPLDDMINKFANDIAYAIGEDILDDMLNDFLE